jgi:hypothetical protein
MEKTKNTPTNKDKAAVEQPKPNHTAKIKSQVLAKIGKPPRLDHLEISRHHNGKYRVNIWQQPEPNKDFTVTFAPRIGLSYYLTVSATGEIIDSNPPMTQLGSHV